MMTSETAVLAGRLAAASAAAGALRGAVRAGQPGAEDVPGSERRAAAGGS